LRIKFFILALASVYFVVFILPFNRNAIAQNASIIGQLVNSDAKTFLSTLIIISLSLIIIIFLIASCFVANAALKNNDKTAEFLNSFFTSTNALQILTVSAVMLTTVFLALSDRLTDGALALLSSVAGYVLGNLQKQPEKSNKNKEEEG
jgi:hypothetical protein